MSVRAIRELALMRVRTFLREPEAFFWTFGFPILMTIGLGLAFREEAAPAPVLIGVETGTVAESWFGALSADPELEPMWLDTEAADRALRRGEVPLVLSGADTLVFRYDPAREESRVARLLAEAAIQRGAGVEPAVVINSDANRLPGGRYIDWLVPGLIGLNLMSTGIWGIGFGLVFMREKKQLKRLVATPMKRSDFLIAQLFGRLAFVLIEVPPVVIFGWLAFGVRMVGSPALFTMVVFLGALAFAGIGLLAASRAKTIEGVGGINNLIMVPMFVLSGVFFSPNRFPEVMQPFIRALPLTALNGALRGVYNEGLGFGAIAPEIAILSIWTIVTFVVALRIFRWR
ncbi:MAG: ABC transporter permease [Gemmatimonadota bacterium]|jgi:ABC-type multidrug transport system permease subunit|nr:ABC transporter permease [Gemmatimonadota bacterium]